ncbi:sigma-54-dependent transcriptional regulator [Nitrospirillum amazonense]|uniref:Two-component system nitrogen regulation response regulator NtrX n=1 Tax=Nitrospirillum amazonense TaxID=28077 RepID=A0A560G5G1_9PROT|nr:sigma-54 dependent transcriptional regulator [Nitrospirillum amazonense]MDG3441647.1 sigma-54 dependent transcriptional regulator [Nitrospirillum amazonense]MEC4592667.1 sigma-54 dependent transcriptional regulator [Nitrospirillum amazonense]TWB17249.1 two-component system nitrogen regulation response regulator NtrX [Nitrospirillum amazonense]TWB29127.1 two-component system nitrogen regulation response regulator NtrX [Nitrospirillum amazonense]TWB79861.1 two-component system nitrogen regula
MAHDILIVDDEADIRMLISGILEDEGMKTREAADADQALAAVAARRPSLIILDIWLQGSRLDGLQILDEMKRDHPDVPVVMISGHGTIETAVAALKKGAYDFIEKPFKSDRLLLLVERAIEAARLRRENRELRLRAGGEVELIGRSLMINQLRQSLDKVAPTGSRVLVSGPPGSGKEIVARIIHEHSRRADGPFVALNCATMRPDRLEVELFGTEHPIDGAGRKVGTFEQAHGGTLFLDEVADMPLETQGKIVRVLQEQTFERVGGSTRVEVDVRVIASTNRDLAAEIEAGQFRQDLYYRLAVVPLKVPSLRERREDIPLLARYFLQRSATASGLPQRVLGEDAMAALQAYEWPGNVRQLRNVMDWLLIMVPGDPDEPIRADMLPPEIGSITPTVLRWEKGGEIMSLPLRDAREVFEREYLLAQVTRFGGNISRTASFVGMERSALHRKLKSLGVHGNERGEGKGEE